MHVDPILVRPRVSSCPMAHAKLAETCLDQIQIPFRATVFKIHVTIGKSTTLMDTAYLAIIMRELNQAIQDVLLIHAVQPKLS